MIFLIVVLIVTILIIHFSYRPINPSSTSTFTSTPNKIIMDIINSCGGSGESDNNYYMCDGSNTCRESTEFCKESIKTYGKDDRCYFGDPTCSGKCKITPPSGGGGGSGGSGGGYKPNITYSCKNNKCIQNDKDNNCTIPDFNCFTESTCNSSCHQADESYLYKKDDEDYWYAVPSSESSDGGIKLSDITDWKCKNDYDCYTDRFGKRINCQDCMRSKCISGLCKISDLNCECPKNNYTLGLPRKVVYAYHMDEPSVLNYFQQFKNMIDCGCTILILSFYQNIIGNDLKNACQSSQNNPNASIDLEGAFGHFLCDLSDTEQTQIMDYARQKNVKIFFSIGGAVGTKNIKDATENGDYKTICDDIYNIVDRFKFEGIDFDLEDTSLFGSVVIDMTNYLYDKFKNNNKKIQISHAPQTANFSGNINNLLKTSYFYVHAKCGDKIDFYNVQTYNQACNCKEYNGCIYNLNDTTNACWSLSWITSGNVYNNPIFEQYLYGSFIPLDKIVLGVGFCEKGGVAYQRIDPCVLRKNLKQAETSMGYRSGLMVWEYNTGSNCNLKQYFDTIFGEQDECKN